MGCCASVKVSPVDNSAETHKINNEFADRSNKGRSKPEEKFSEQNIEQNDKTQIQTESQEDDEETLTTDEVIPHNSSNISSDLVAQTEEDDLLQTYDRDRTDSFEQDKHLQHSIEKSQTSNQSTENRSGILENETTTQREETGEENLISSYEDLRKINRDEEVLSETVSVNKDEGNKTQNETQEDDEESLANKEVIPNDSSSATLDLVSKTENVPNTEIKKNTEHGEENNESFKENKGGFHRNRSTCTFAPEEVKTSIATLADYLLKPANSDSKKARVIFIWIADNIRYNTEGYFSGQYGGTDAESVLLSGTSVCSGYANLFEALCTIAGLPVKVISGFSKGFGYSPEDKFTPMKKTDHAWNAVRIDGHWRFVECTWGAGFLDKNNSFQKKLEPFYFFTEPKHFINAHFPWNPEEEGFSNSWQLLENPISLETYHKALKLEHSAMMWNVFPLTHKEGIVQAHEEIVIEIEDKNEFLCGTTSKIYDMKTGLSCNEFIFLRQEKSGLFSISIRPPSNGKYELIIYGKVDRTENTYQSLMTYLIRFSDVSKKFSPYPENNGQMWGMDLEAFDNGFLKKDNNRVPVKIISEDGFVDMTFATTQNVPTLAKIIPATKKLPWSKEKYSLVTTTHTSLNIKACFPNMDLYKLELMCKRVDGDDDLYHDMACFLIECTKPADPCPGYPKAYPRAQTYGSKLIEPLSAQLPANTTVTCRFQSPLVVKAMVAKISMTQNKDEWSGTVTTPSCGAAFYISGNIDGGNSYSRLYEFEII
uniref:Transglutaminase-like domain-containing protein n=1 Tax=Magallana gigas TaxID=29159 RepID=A0A8W8ND31_MAGGI